MPRPNPPRRKPSEPASEARPPLDVKPQLATAAKQIPTHGDWSYEIKFDGYRMMTRIDRGDVRLITRGGHDWAARMPELRNALATLDVQGAWLDGEAVVFNAAGRPDFNALQNAFDRNRTGEIILFVFDLLWLDGVDLRERPLRERRAKLQQLLDAVASPLVRFSVDFGEDPRSLFASANKLHLEGIMGKRADAPYRSGRNADWIKLKCNSRQEFVIGGFTRPKGAGSGIDSLLLGVFELDGTVRYAGNVQPHLKSRAAAAFSKRALSLHRTSSPFRNPPRRERGSDYQWLTPELVCEVSFLEWTKSGGLRHPVFQAFRDDKGAREVTREPLVDIADPSASAPVKTTGLVPSRGAVTVCGITITNGDRIIDRSAGHSKLEVVRYYDAVAEWALPHLRNRPLSLLRAPEGIDGEQFFQKNAERAAIPGVETLSAALHPGHSPLIVANAHRALVGLAQVGTVELHTWNAVAPDLAHPDRVVFDLDPDPALPWQTMVEAALLVKVVLDEIGLVSFVKTSGGKGLHVVVPLARKHDWAEVKAFSKALAQHMAKVVPQRFSAVSGPKNRVGKIFIDYLRNSKGASTVAAFSVRARPGMGVSMPLAWTELKELKRADEWGMQAAIARQRRLGGDAWAGYWEVRQGIGASMRLAVGAPSR